MRFILPLFLSFFVMLQPAAAQDSWSFEPDREGGVQAIACPLMDTEVTGNYLCLMVGCAQGQPLRWRLAMAGGGLPDPLRVDFFVDEEPSGFLELVGVASDLPYDVQKQVDPERDIALLQALKDGGRAAIALHGADGETFEHALTLRGSSKAIAAAEELCPLRPAPVADPVALVTDELARECREIGGEIEVLDSFLRREDLDNDGREDLVIEYGSAPCSAALSLHCGSGGCVTDVYLARDEGYMRAWSDVLRGVSDEPGEPTMALSVHGSACDAAGVVSCVLRVDLSGETPQVIERISGPDADAWIEALRVRESGAAAGAGDAAEAGAAQE